MGGVRKTTSRRKCNRMSTLVKRPVLRLKNRGGAPKGNRNALKTGGHTREVRELFARIAAFKRRVKAAVAAAEEEMAHRAQ